MLAPVKLATTAIAAILSTASVQNAVETFRLTRSNTRLPEKDGSPSLILNKYLQHGVESEQAGFNAKVPQGFSSEDVIEDLRSMSRKDLLTLFKYCDPPDDLNEIEGEWDGILLDNNFVLVRSDRTEHYVFIILHQS